MLNTTIHHPTLLSILLDVTLAHGLLYESNTVLRAFFFVALTPLSADARPPICHPAHSGFLLELHARWIGGGFRGQEFCRILTEALHAVHSREAWGCRAVHKFAKAICGSDFSLFVELAGSCTSMALELNRSNRRIVRTTKLKQHDDSILVWTRVQQWFKIACEHCITTEESSMENSDVIYAILESSLSSNLYHDICSVDNADHLHADLQGSIVCLATYWLSSPFILNSQKDRIVKKLKEITPRSSTYVTLATKSLAKSSLSFGQNKLRSFAMTLRLQDLLRLESSLWACALRHIECLASEHPFGSSNGMDEIRAYRDRLIELVDDAEQRCFGVGSRSPETGQSSSGHAEVNNATVSTVSGSSCEWQWEATIGCWVRRDNGHRSQRKKRRKVEMSSLPEYRSLDLCRPSGERKWLSQSGRLPLHRSSARKFTPLLTNAFSQRTVLHDETTQGREICLSPTVDSERGVLTLESDDLLDLFLE